MVCTLIQRTVFPVNPWQITLVFLSTQTFAVELIIRVLPRWHKVLLVKEEENIIVLLVVVLMGGDYDER